MSFRKFPVKLWKIYCGGQANSGKRIKLQQKSLRGKIASRLE
jgi:hypothetical protein